MSSLKDSLNSDTQVFTLTEADKQFLAHVHAYIQQELDVLQQHFAASFLNHIATTRFGYSGGMDLRFNYDPEKALDNLTITNMTEK